MDCITRYEDLEAAIRQFESAYPDVSPDPILDKLSRKPYECINADRSDPAYQHPLVKEAILRVTRPMSMLYHHYNRGTQSAGLKKTDQALDDYQYAIETLGWLGITPENFKDYFNTSESESLLANLFHNTGAILATQGDFRMAMQYFSIAGQYNDKIPNLRENIAALKRLLNPGDLQDRHHEQAGAYRG